MVWHGDQRKHFFLLVIDKARKRRETTPALDLWINSERLKTLDINDACRYLSYWGMGNGHISATREVVREKARVARESELEGCKKSGYKRTKTHGTYHGQVKTLCTPSQLQRLAMSAPCRQEYSHRPCCSTLTNACGIKMS